MPCYSYTVIVEAATPEHADKVMGERIGFDEDYGFDYRIGYPEDFPGQEVQSR